MHFDSLRSEDLQIINTHAPSFDDVDGGRDEGGGEAGRDGRREVAGHAVGHEATRDQLVLDHVIHDDLPHVDDGSATNVRERAWCEEQENEDN